jgi:hypothetical protein
MAAVAIDFKMATLESLLDPAGHVLGRRIHHFLFSFVAGIRWPISASQGLPTQSA